MFEQQKVAIFVDGQNCYYSVKRLFEDANSMVYPNYEHFLTLVGDRVLTYANAYVIDAVGVEQEGFFKSLHTLGYSVKKKKTKVFNSGEMKGNMDIEMAVDIFSVLNKVDTVILVTGDGDFIPMLTFLKGRGIKTEIYCYDKSYDPALLEEADAGGVFDMEKAAIVKKKKV